MYNIVRNFSERNSYINREGEREREKQGKRESLCVLREWGSRKMRI